MKAEWGLVMDVMPHIKTEGGGGEGGSCSCITAIEVGGLFMNFMAYMATNGGLFMHVMPNKAINRVGWGYVLAIHSYFLIFIDCSVDKYCANIVRTINSVLFITTCMCLCNDVYIFIHVCF